MKRIVTNFKYLTSNREPKTLPHSQSTARTSFYERNFNIGLSRSFGLQNIVNHRMNAKGINMGKLVTKQPLTAGD